MIYWALSAFFARLMTHTVKIYRGRTATGLIGAVALLAIVSIVGSNIDLLLKLGLTIGVMLYTFWTFRYWPNVQRWRCLRFQTGGVLSLTDHADRSIRVRAGQGGIASPWFVSFPVKTPDQHQYLVYGFKDQFDAEGYRHLLRHLRFEAGADHD